MSKDEEIVEMGRENITYDISVLICSYNPDLIKILTTINSCILQQNINIQIVISDDGTKGFEFNSIVDYFEKKEFEDYVITHLKQNSGTVKNVINGLKYCKGKYTKIITPGDYLYKKNILKEWLQLIKREKAVVSFSNCIHYRYVNNEIVPIAVSPNPYENQKFYKGLWEYNYLVLDDVATGVAVLANTYKLIEYYGYIEDKVKYADDNVFRIMAFNHEKACYFREDAVIYENGTGISTGGNEFWKHKILHDWHMTDELMLGKLNKEDMLHRNYLGLMKYKRQKNIFLRRIQLVFVRGKIAFVLKKRKNKRLTNTNVDIEYINELVRI